MQPPRVCGRGAAHIARHRVATLQTSPEYDLADTYTVAWARRHGGLPVSKCPLCSCFLTVGVHQELTPTCSYFVLSTAVVPFRNTPCRIYFRLASLASSSYDQRLPVLSTHDGSVRSKARSSQRELGVTATEQIRCQCRKLARTSFHPPRQRARNLSY